MKTIMSSSSSDSVPLESSSTYDEVLMQQSLHLSDSLRDLKHLRTQLYSAADYFEISYTNENQKEVVINTLKDYTVKALVNTVDHLGSITYKVTDLLDEKVDEVSGTELRVLCIEQRLKTCQECIDRQGLSQQSFVMTTPKYHKRYMLPVRERKHGSEHVLSEYHGGSLENEVNWNHLKTEVQMTLGDTRSSFVRKELSPSPSLKHSSQSGNFSFIERQKVSEKRTSSPLGKFPLLRSGSLSSRSTTPKPSRPTTPNSSNMRPRYPSAPRSSSMRLRAERDNQNDIEQSPSKSKRLLKALLSRRKSKKDDTLYTFLDEY
ncbi:Abil3 [Thalictrum thalictroides]|uniref:Abil3 n=1 Tax=Thalictrum thalictroides TaxID=46969 RepID=A0A7J6W084_THATH|nr:Abil3 [Thalictrum thalictroides]